MELTFICSQQDTEFIDSIYEAFGSEYSIDKYEINGITGYDKVMLVVAGATLLVNAFVPFIAANMTSQANDDKVAKRCIVNKQNETITFDGYNDEEIAHILNAIITE